MMMLGRSEIWTRERGVHNFERELGLNCSEVVIIVFAAAQLFSEDPNLAFLFRPSCVPPLQSIWPHLPAFFPQNPALVSYGEVARVAPNTATLSDFMGTLRSRGKGDFSRGLFAAEEVVMWIGCARGYRRVLPSKPLYDVIGSRGGHTEWTEYYGPSTVLCVKEIC